MAGGRAGETNPPEMPRLTGRVKPEGGVAATEERVQEPSVARRAPLVGRDLVALGIGCGHHLVDVDGHAYLGALYEGTNRLRRAAMRANLVVGHAHRRRPIAQARRVDAVGVAEEREDGRFVER